VDIPITSKIRLFKFKGNDFVFFLRVIYFISYVSHFPLFNDVLIIGCFVLDSILTSYTIHSVWLIGEIFNLVKSLNYLSIIKTSISEFAGFWLAVFGGLQNHQGSLTSALSLGYKSATPFGPKHHKV
jgi:hypothetical protein